MGYRHATGLLSALLLVSQAAFAQSSVSFRMSNPVFTQGGHPQGGAVLGSASYRVTIDSVGEGLATPDLGSAGFAMRAGFALCFSPAGEVQGMRALADKTTFSWTAEPSVGDYSVYRGTLDTLPGTYGACRLSGVASTSTALSEIPGATGYFYLITARNLLREEGTKGSSSAGLLRGNPTPCP